MSYASLPRLIVVLLLPLCMSGADTVSAAQSGGTDTASYDRRSFYSQPMGYSIWKRPPASVQEFAELVERGRLNATAQQYAQSLYDAGWIPQPDTAAAQTYIRSLKEARTEETRTLRIGRILRSYRTGERTLDSNFHQIMNAGERGYFTHKGELVVRELCLNVVYPERHAAPPPAQPLTAPVSAPAEPPVAEPAVAVPPVDFRFDPPPQFEPPARESERSVSPSTP